MIGAARAGELTVAFWNVENLFDEYVDKRVPDADVFLRETVQEKLRKDAVILRQLNADIVGLMEVENRGILRELCENHLADLGYRYFELSEESDGRGIDVALVARQPFLARSVAVSEFYRGILVCRFTVEGEPLYVLVNHWKSRFGGGEAQRMNCARRVAQLVNEDIPHYEGRPVPVIVGGDFNDDDTDASVQHLETVGLTNLLKHLPAEQRWTLPYDNRDENRVEYNGFDHVFTNEFLPGPSAPDTSIPAAFRILEARVVRPQIMLKTRRLYGELHLWPDDDDADYIGYSDHFPVVARLQTP